MDYINIGVIGVPKVGKSTLINNFIGTNKAESDTCDITPYTLNKVESVDLYKADHYKFIDLPGIENEKIAKDSSYRFTKNNFGDFDVLIVVCDLKTYKDDEDSYIKLIKKIDTLNEDNRVKTMLVVNKCDTLDYVSDREFIFTNEIEEEDYYYIKNSIQNHIDVGHIFPACLKKANIFIRGKNNDLQKVQDYKSNLNFKIFKNMSENILQSVGINSIINHINNAIDEDKNRLIEHHISNTLNIDDILDLTQIDNIVEKLPNDTLLKDAVKYRVMSYVADQLNTHESLTNNENIYRVLCDRYLNKFNEQLDEDNYYETKKREIAINYKWKTLENNKVFDSNLIKELYGINKLYPERFYKFIKNTITDNIDIVHYVEDIRVSTNGDIAYIYLVMKAYIEYKHYFLNILNILTIGDPMFAFIKYKLNKEFTPSEFNFDFKDYDCFKRDYKLAKDLLRLFRPK